MTTIVYWLIIFYMSVLTIWDMFREENIKQQSACALVLVPMILRLLLIK